MMKKRITLLVLACLPTVLFAQKGLFTEEKLPSREGFIVSVNGNFDMPGGDMADRFGASYRIGLAVHYKLKNNWMYGVRFDFLNGNKIKEPGLFSGITDNQGTFFNLDGQRLAVNKYERGYLVGIQLGRVFNWSKTSSDNGILCLTSIGFMQHKILIQDKSESIISLRGDYRKGYDRLANGVYLEQYIGYLFLSNNGLINFHLGVDFLAGFTEGRRDFWYDVRRPGNEKRFDILFGIRGGWCVPLFKRKSEEFFFE